MAKIGSLLTGHKRLKVSIGTGQTRQRIKKKLGPDRTGNTDIKSPLSPMKYLESTTKSIIQLPAIVVLQ
jgi:hypothetical protein